MKVIVTRQNRDGSFDEVGMNNRALYSDLRTVGGVTRRARKRWPAGALRLEVFRGSFYGNPSEVRFVK